MMSPGVRGLCVGCGPVFLVLFFTGLLLAGLVPPPSPADSAVQVAEFWSARVDLRRSGIILMIFAATLQVPFGAILAVRVKSIEGRESPLTYVMIVGTALSVVTIIMPVFAFAAAVFRPHRPADITQALNDLGWLPLLMNLPAILVQCLALALAVLGDRRKVPLWPRWAGYYNLWTAFLVCTGGFVIFFKTGAFAWNGLLAFWLAAILFGVWILVTSYLLLHANSAADDTGGPSDRRTTDDEIP